MAEGFVSDFRRFFLRGLAAVLPTLLTLMIIVYVFSFVDKYIGQYINAAILKILRELWGQVPHSSTEKVLSDSAERMWQDYFWWVGFALAIVAIYIFGRFAASFVGRRIWRMTEGGLRRLPIIGTIYPHVKQVTDVLFSEKKIEFSRVVGVEYPRKGIWSLGLVTGPGLRTLQNAAAGDLLTVFVPSSPVPLTGYTITVRRKEVVDLPMSIDDALRFTVSGGVITPNNQKLSELEIEQARQGIYPMLHEKEIAE